MKPGLSGSGKVPPSPACLASQMARKSVPFLNTDVWSKELLWAITKSGRTQQEQTPDKVAPHTHTVPKGPSLFTTQAHGICHRQAGPLNKGKRNEAWAAGLEAPPFLTTGWGLGHPRARWEGWPQSKET